MLVELLGTDVRAVAVNRSGKGGNAVATMFFKDGLTAALHCTMSRGGGFQLAVHTGAGVLSEKLQSDPNPYLTGIRTFCRMFKTGVEPIEHKRFLAPIAVLESMEKSVKTGRVVPVARL